MDKGKRYVDLHTALDILMFFFSASVVPLAFSGALISSLICIDCLGKLVFVIKMDEAQLVKEHKLEQVSICIMNKALLLGAIGERHMVARSI